MLYKLSPNIFNLLTKILGISIIGIKGKKLTIPGQILPYFRNILLMPHNSASIPLVQYLILTLVYHPPNNLIDIIKLID